MTASMPERSRAVAGVFDRASATYDQVGVPWFTPIAAGLVAELQPRTGERALDVGCGRGAALLPLAAAVGPGGRAVGIDAAPGMVAACSADAARQDLRQVEVLLMDAAAPALEPASFDVVAASLVLFFLPDPRAALAAWCDLLVPGGRLGVATFGEQDPRWRQVDDCFSPYLPASLLDARTSGSTGPFGSDAAMESLFAACGLQEVRTVVVRVPLTFRDADQWRQWSASHGQRAMWECVPQARRPDVLAEAARRLEQVRDATGRMSTWQDVRYTVGRRAHGHAP